MFCPQCKAEYRDGYTRCSSCDVKLVVWLPGDEAADAPEKGHLSEPPVLLWSGQDPVTFSVILSALNGAGIPYRELQSRDFAASLSQPLSLGFYGMPHWEVRIHPRELEAARAAVQAAMSPQPVVHTESREPETGGEAAPSRMDSAKTETKAQTPVAVWSAKEPVQAELFRAALAENNIHCWAITASAGSIRLFVSRDDAWRAREIIGDTIQKMSAA